MKTKQIILLIVVVVIVSILIWFFLPEPTCKEKCKSLGYNVGICRSGAVVPNITRCEINETEIGETKDCTTVKKIGRIVTSVSLGAWKTCCCI